MSDSTGGSAMNSDNDETLFKGVDMFGVDFWVSFDGQEGIAVWIGDPDGVTQPLSLEQFGRLIEWFRPYVERSQT